MLKGLQLLERMMNELSSGTPVTAAKSEPPPPSGVIEPAKPQSRKPGTRTPQQNARRWVNHPDSTEMEAVDSTDNIPKEDYAHTPEVHAQILALVEKHKVLPMPRIAELLGKSKGSLDVQLKKLAQRGQLVLGYTKIKGHHTKLAAMSYAAIAEWEASRGRSSRA